MNKKASMQLGINAIVVLIIALAILGLAMVFINRLFSQSSDEFDSQFNKDNAISPPADSSQPIKFETEELTIIPGNEKSFAISIYNSDFNPDNEISLVIAGCTNDMEENIILEAEPQTIDVGKAFEFASLISVEEGTPQKRYICSVKATDGTEELSKQLIIKVEA